MPEWFPKIASHLLTGVILVLVIQQMVRKRAVLKEDGRGIVLGYSRWFAGLGVVVFSMFTFIGGYSVYHRTDGWQTILVVSGAFLLGGAFIFLYAFFTKVEIDDDKIVSRAFWRAPVTLHWMEVREVDFIWTKHFRLASSDGRKIYVDMMMGGLNHFLAAVAKRLSVEKYLEGMRVYWKVAQGYHKSVGNVLAIPPTDTVKIFGVIDPKDLKTLFGKIASRVEEGMGDKAVKEILDQVKKPKPNQNVFLEKQVLFQGMPIRLFLFFFFAEDGRYHLTFFAPLKLAEMIKGDMQKSGATEVALVVDEDEDEDDEEENAEPSGAQ